MFDLAVKAGIPLIAVRTRDVLHVRTVIRHLTGKASIITYPGKGQLALIPGQLYLLDSSSGAFHPKKAIKELLKNESSLIAVNMKQVPLEFHDAGSLPTPKKLVASKLEAALGDSDLVSALLPSLGGLNLKEVDEALRMCGARDHQITPEGLMSVRRECFPPTRGLTQVKTANLQYRPLEELEEWAAIEAPFFLGEQDDRLCPRGLLFDGDPGTGKTMGAKYIASEFSVPLYRLDLGEVKGKYVGESEHALNDALAQVDSEEPCVLLIDEVEKLFSAKPHEGDGGTTTNMLATLLWWLAEHSSKVLTIMTTNDRTIIPPELYRDGRIDDVLNFVGLQEEEAIEFAEWVAEDFDVELNLPYLKSLIEAAKKPISQAKLTKMVRKLVKLTLQGEKV